MISSLRPRPYEALVWHPSPLMKVHTLTYQRSGCESAAVGACHRSSIPLPSLYGIICRRVGRGR